MRRWLAVLAFALGLAFGFIGRATGAGWLDTISGLAFLAALFLLLSSFAFWKRAFPRFAPMPGLFQRPASKQRWCTRCGSPTKVGPCAVCGHEKADKPAKPKRVKPKPRRS